MRSITLFVFGGVSEIQEEAHNPSSEFWIAIIGPFSSFFLSLSFYLLSHGISSHVQAAAVCNRLSSINLALGVFNLVPAFPLDGGRVLRSILWKTSGSFQKATVTSGRIGQSFGYLLIMLGILMAIGTRNFVGGLWIGFIGWFLMNAAEGSVQDRKVRDALEGAVAGEIMTTDCPTIPESLTIEELVHRYVLPGGQRFFFVVRGDTLAGVISLGDIKRVPREQWQTPVGEVMKRADSLITITSQTRIEKILRLMDDQKVNQIPVMEGNKAVGLITREHLLNLIRIRLDLE